MKRKKPYTFTLDERLMEWFKHYSTIEQRSMSNILNGYILNLMRNDTTTSKKPLDVIKIKK